MPTGNEAHYFIKAKHFADSSWASSDFFLQSGNTHLVFYVAFGWLTQFLSLSATVWVVRILAWTLLAFSWVRLSRAISPRPFLSVLFAAIFLATQRRFSMSLAWVVYGAEAKVFAYALLFLALADLIHEKWGRMWILLGASTLWHPVVGGWGTLVALVCALAFTRGITPVWNHPLSLAIALLLALGGMIPALMVNRGADSETSLEAIGILVYNRIPHHLYPPGFLPGKVTGHLPLIGAWLILGFISWRDRNARRFQLFVLGTAVLTLIGLAITFLTREHSPIQAKLLRFYLFRLFDVMVALGVGAGVIFIASLLWESRQKLTLWLTLWIGAVGFHFYDHWPTTSRSVPIQFKLGKTQEEFHAWRSLCEWIGENTPKDALFLTPTKSQTFVWYAHRGEVVSWKNVPQDAKSLVEWQNRMLAIHGTMNSQKLSMHFSEETIKKLKDIAKRYGARYLIYFAGKKVSLPVVKRNEHFVLYSISDHPLKS